MDQRNFANEQFLWLRQVASDPTLTGVASRVANVLTRYFSRDSRLAYPAHGTLAAELSVTDRAIRATISKMIEQGHLGVVGNRHGGRRQTNRYRLILRTLKGGTPVPGFVQERRNNRSENPEQTFRKPGTTVPETRNNRSTELTY